MFAVAIQTRDGDRTGLTVKVFLIDSNSPCYESYVMVHNVWCNGKYVVDKSSWKQGKVERFEVSKSVVWSIIDHILSHIICPTSIEAFQIQCVFPTSARAF